MRLGRLSPSSRLRSPILRMIVNGRVSLLGTILLGLWRPRWALSSAEWRQVLYKHGAPRSCRVTKPCLAYTQGWELGLAVYFLPYPPVWKSYRWQSREGRDLLDCINLAASSGIFQRSSLLTPLPAVSSSRACSLIGFI